MRRARSGVRLDGGSPVGRPGVARVADRWAARGRPVGTPSGTGRLVVGALVVGLTVAGCVAGSGSRGPSGTPGTSAGPALPDDVAAGLAVEIRQSRADWGRRVVQVRVANTGAVDVTVRHATLTTPGVEGSATSEREREVRAGVDRDLSVALGAPVCDGSAAVTATGEAGAAASGTSTAGAAASGSAGAQVELDVVDSDGHVGTVVVVPDDPQGHLARIHGEDCAALAVAAGARLSLDDDLPSAPVDGTLVGRLTLHVEAVPGGPRVEVWRVDRTNLVIPADLANDWPVAVDTAAPGAPAAVELAVVPSRCDPHAVAEDKRGTFFGVHARVDGVEQPVFYVAASDVLRGAVYDLVAASCGWETG